MSELKACPFHNSHTCGCWADVNLNDKAWNTRPIEDALRSEVDKLNTIIHSMHAQTEVDLLRSENEQLQSMLDELANQFNTGMDAHMMLIEENERFCSLLKEVKEDAELWYSWQSNPCLDLDTCCLCDKRHVTLMEKLKQEVVG